MPTEAKTRAHRGSLRNRRIADGLRALHEQIAFRVIALPSLADHGLYDTLEQAHGCVAFDGLSEFQIWRGDVLVRCEEFA